MGHARWRGTYRGRSTSIFDGDRRLVRALLREDSHYCWPEVPDLCDRLGLRHVLGLSRNARLQDEVQALEASAAAGNGGKKLGWSIHSLCSGGLGKTSARRSSCRTQFLRASHSLHRDQSRRCTRRKPLVVRGLRPTPEPGTYQCRVFSRRGREIPASTFCATASGSTQKFFPTRAKYC